MNKATFLSVQLNVEDISASSGLVELLNNHLVFAADVAEAADELVQHASVARLSGVEATVEIPALVVERLRDVDSPVLRPNADVPISQRDAEVANGRVQALGGKNLSDPHL